MSPWALVMALLAADPALDAPKVFQTAEVASCARPDGSTVGPGCWMAAEDCRVDAMQRRALRAAIASQEVQRKVEQEKAGQNAAMGILLLSLVFGGGMAAGAVLAK